MPLAESSDPSRTRSGITRIGLSVSADHVIGGMASVRLFLSVIIAAMVGGGCASEAQRQRDADDALIIQAQAGVGAKLLDPTSPIFSDVTVRRNEVCGSVNAKNTFGGYVGRKRFTFTEAAQATLEPDPNEFSLLRKEVREGPSCMFDIEYRNCKGEAGVPQLHDLPHLSQ